MERRSFLLNLERKTYLVMKQATLINVIDEEFGDALDMSWLINVYLKAFQKNDAKIKEATGEYWLRSKLVTDTLSTLLDQLKEDEKAENKNGVRILHKRPEQFKVKGE